MAAILVVAIALRLAGLDSQLWHDEISALNSIRRPAADILTTWPGSSSHVLFELLAHTAYAIAGEQPWAIRLPAALFGILGVAAFALFALRWLERATALFATALLAVSYHHIFYSQNARGYTALMTLALASTWAISLWPRDRAPGRAPRALYVVCAAATTYANPFGVFVPVGHALVLFAPWLRGRRVPGQFAHLATFAAVAAATAALYLPFVPSMMAFAQMNIATPAEGPRMGSGLALELLEGLIAATGGGAPLIAAGIAGGVGLVRWMLLRPFVLALLVAPLAVQVVVFAVAGVGVHPRYFAVALPLAVLVGAEGVATLVTAGVRLLIPPDAWRRGGAAAALTAIVVVTAYPLVRYYSIPKQDYLGAIAVLEDLEANGGRCVAVGITANAMNGYYGTRFLAAERLEDLLAIERAADRPIHLATTLERLLTLAEPALMDHIRREYRIERFLPGSVGDAGLRIYTRQHVLTSGGRP